MFSVALDKCTLKTEQWNQDKQRKSSPGWTQIAAGEQKGPKVNNKKSRMPDGHQGDPGTEIISQTPQFPAGQTGGFPNGICPCQPGNNPYQQNMYINPMQPPGTFLSEGDMRMLLAGAYQQGRNDTAAKEYYKFQRQLYRRPRAKKGSCRVAIDNDKKIILYQVMSDGSRDTKKFISNYNGPIAITTVKTPGFNMRNAYLVLLFVNNNVSVFIDIKKTGNGVYLYEQFRKAKVQFNTLLSKTDIKEGLVELLVSWDDWEFKEPVLLDAFPGWSCAGGSSLTFQSCENTLWGKDIGEELPVSEKSFHRIMPTPQGLETYIRELRMMFPDPAERMLLASWPIAGLLSSLLRKHGVPIKAVLNLIPTGDVNQEAIAGMLQVFSRSRLAIFDAGKSQKQLDGILDKSRDEVLIFDCRYQSNQYQRNLRKQTADRLLRMVGENEKTGSGRNADFAVVLLSDQYQPGAFNVLLPEMNECFSSGVSRLGESQGLEMVLSGVVNKIEGRFEEAEQIFCRRWNCPDFRLMPISIAIDFLRDFFRSVGRDLDKELALPEISDLAALIEDNGDSEDERRDLFIRVIRSHASRWMCEEKHYRQEYHEGTLYYDENYLYCPVDMFKKLFAEVHRAALLLRVLVEIRNRGDLITDGPNLMGKKVMIGNERKDYYVFPISLFNRKGLPGILDLARRPEDD